MALRKRRAVSTAIFVKKKLRCLRVERWLATADWDGGMEYGGIGWRSRQPVNRLASHAACRSAVSTC